MRREDHRIDWSCIVTGWTRRARAGLAGMLLLGLVACGRGGQDYAADAAAGAVASPEGAFLAYEHDLRIQLDAKRISERVKAVSEACQSNRFGDCAVLQVGEEGGETRSGSIRVRIAPKGVEPIIALAGEGGDVASRNTHAEDLAQQVADTVLTQARLQKEHAQLQAYQQRSDMKVADLLAVSQRMAEIEAGLEQANKDAAQQRRRIDTQLVTMRFEGPAGQRSRSEIGKAVSEFGSIVTTSIAFVIRAVAALLPVGVVAWAVGAVVVALWRRRKRRKAAAAAR